MDLVKKIKLWRRVGQFLNTKIGASVSHAIGQPVNWMASRAVFTNKEPGILTDLPYKWRRSIYEEVTWDSIVAGR